MSIFQKSNKRISSRRQINIKGVRQGLLMLPGNEYRLILEVSPVNYHLKSEEEKDAIIGAYEDFLNSLEKPIQILTRVRKMDISSYLDDFRKHEEVEQDKIYKQQIASYITFVESLTDLNKIMSRHFYVILSHKSNSKSDFEEVHSQLSIDKDVVVKGLRRLGVQTRQLGDFEILDLFYDYYHEDAASQRLSGQAYELISSLFVEGGNDEKSN